MNIRLFHVTDWLPTLVKAAGGSIPKKIDGLDQWSALQNPKEDWPRSEMVYNIQFKNGYIRGGIR